jgi:hypothetical protein
MIYEQVATLSSEDAPAASTASLSGNTAGEIAGMIEDDMTNGRKKIHFSLPWPRE